MYSVKPGEKAVIFNRIVGVKSGVLSEGTHVAIPWFEWPIIFDVRTRPRAIKSTTGTRDLQMVDIGLRVLTRPDPSALPEIYRKLGLDYDAYVPQHDWHKISFGEALGYLNDTNAVRGKKNAGWLWEGVWRAVEVPGGLREGWWRVVLPIHL